MSAEESNNIFAFSLPKSATAPFQTAQDDVQKYAELEHQVAAMLNVLHTECSQMSKTMRAIEPDSTQRMMDGLELFSKSMLALVQRLQADACQATKIITADAEIVYLD